MPIRGRPNPTMRPSERSGVQHTRLWGWAEEVGGGILTASVVNVAVAKTPAGRESAVIPGLAGIPATTPPVHTNQDERSDQGHGPHAASSVRRSGTATTPHPQFSMSRTRSSWLTVPSLFRSAGQPELREHRPQAASRVRRSGTRTRQSPSRSPSGGLMGVKRTVAIPVGPTPSATI